METGDANRHQAYRIQPLCSSSDPKGQDFGRQDLLERDVRIVDTVEFLEGWTAATMAVLEIWEKTKATFSDPEEVLGSFDAFMIMCELRMRGATWSEMAVVAELNDKGFLAELLREKEEG